MEDVQGQVEGVAEGLEEEKGVSLGACGESALQYSRFLVVLPC